MMRYSEFKNIIEVYHKLRKEGILFPLRNPNDRYAIHHPYDTSPIFEAVEQDFIYEVILKGT